MNKTHEEFLGEVEKASSHEAQTEGSLAEKTQTKSDLNSMEKRDTFQELSD